MLNIDEMVRRLTALAFDTNDDDLLGVIDRFEAADADWNEKRTMLNKVNAEKAYKVLRREYQTRIQGV